MTTFKIGFDVPFPPFAELSEGRPRGLLLDLVAAALEHTGVLWEWTPMPLDETEPALASGRVHALAFKGITPERHAIMDFSGSLLVSGSALFRGAGIAPSDDPGDFSGMRIVTPRKGPLIRQVERLYPKLEVVPTTSYEESLERLVSGEVPLAALNFHAGIALANALHPGKVGLPTKPYAPLDMGFVVAKGRHPELLAAFEKALAALKTEGVAQKLTTPG